MHIRSLACPLFQARIHFAAQTTERLFSLHFKKSLAMLKTVSKLNRPSLILAGSGILLAIGVIGVQHTPASAPVQAENKQEMFAFVRSLEGTKPDGDLKVLAGDKLLVDAELARTFDYYLSAMGEKSLDAIKIEAERELERKLSPAAAAEAKRLLGRYLDYKRALVDVEKNQTLTGNNAANLRARFLAMQQARNQFFSPQESQGLFGFNDSYDMDAISRMEIAENKALDARQKQEKLAQLDAAMPPALKEEREAPLRIVKAEQAVKDMRSKGASEQDIYQFRTATFSPEAAARLAEVDREEAQWHSRISNYQQERKAILANQQSDSSKELALQQLRQARFSPAEQSRLVAYE